MKVKFIIFLCSLFLGVSQLCADTIEEAAKSYDSGDYKKAISLYREVVEKKGESADLLYNLGNAYVKDGDYGNGMVCYLKSYRIDPSDKELKNNIRYLSQKVEDNNKAELKGKKVSVVAEDKPFFSDLKNHIVYSYGKNTWAWWSGVMFVITTLFAAVYIFTANVNLRKIGFFGGIVTLGVSVITLVFALMSASARGKESAGVIVAYKVNLLQNPSKDSKTVENPLTRGTVLDILEAEGTENEGKNLEENGSEKWYKVRLNSDFTGWISSNDFEVI